MFIDWNWTFREDVESIRYGSLLRHDGFLIENKKKKKKKKKNLILFKGLTISGV
jgi:hypothetical protein